LGGGYLILGGRNYSFYSYSFPPQFTPTPSPPATTDTTAITTTATFTAITTTPTSIFGFILLIFLQLLFY
jgi:hypothetical protein